MALSKATNIKGFTASYWCIKGKAEDRVSDTTAVTVALFKDESTSKEMSAEVPADPGVAPTPPRNPTPENPRAEPGSPGRPPRAAVPPQRIGWKNELVAATLKVPGVGHDYAALYALIKATPQFAGSTDC